MRQAIRAWWITFRHGSRFTRTGRELRRNLRDPFDATRYVEVERPRENTEHDEWCDANGCRCGKCPCLGPPSCSTVPAS